MNDKMYKEVAEYWGDKMPMMAMEEMAELIKAISKLERNLSVGVIQVGEQESDLMNTIEELNDKQKSAWLNVVEEIGDVFISCKAIMCRYGITQELVDKRISDKLKKKY